MDRCIILGHQVEGEHYVSLRAASSETVSNLLQASCTPAHTNTSQKASVEQTETSNADTHPPGTSSSQLSPIDLGTIADGPARPFLHTYPKRNIGKQNRAFSATQYESYDFIEYSILSDAVYCFPCRHFSSATSYNDPAFTDKGMRDWKKITKKLDKHASTATHTDCYSRWNEYKNSQKTGSVVSQLSRAHKVVVAENWEYAEKVAEIVLFLARQGLAVRGHDESRDSMNRGNFLELCSLFGKYDKKFADRLQNSSCLISHESQNELLTIAAEQLISTVADEVRSVGFFCVIADEARSFRDEQLAVCVRYAVDLEVRERFVAFVDCSECRDAEGITGKLLGTLKTAGLNDIPVIAQAYDGAAVMSGKDSGVQKQVRDVHPMAVYIHCMAHRLNLVIVASCTVNRQVQKFFSNIQSMYTFFSRPGNNKSFQKVREILGMSAKTPVLTDLSDTRWACRWRNVNATKQSLSALVASLQQLSQPESGNRCIAEAAGLLHELQQTAFVVCLIVLEKVLSLVQVCHAVLQKKRQHTGAGVVHCREHCGFA